MATVGQLPVGSLDVRRALGWVAVALALTVGIVGLRSASQPVARDAPVAAVAARPVLVGLLPERPAVAATYEVVSGDTASTIAATHGVGVDDLVAVNGLSAPDALSVGQRLRIPSPR